MIPNSSQLLIIKCLNLCMKGQVQVTNAFETSSLVINPYGFDVQDYLRMAPNNELSLSDGIREVVKPKGNKRQIEKWSTYPERSVLDIIMAIEDDYGETKVMLLDTIAKPILGVSADVLLGGSLEEIWAVNEIISEDDDTVTNVVSSDRSSGQISLISIDEEDNTCLSSTPVSKRRGDNDIDDLSSTSKKQCSKVIKVEKNIGN
ncbi:hypothetical protein Bca101_086322 [Brassica carinata]